METEQTVCQYIQSMKASKMTHEAVAKYYGPPVNKADISRILRGRFPKGEQKRDALGLAPSASVVVMGEGVVPDGAQVIRALLCSCNRWFIPNNPARTHCFICRPAKIKERP